MTRGCPNDQFSLCVRRSGGWLLPSHDEDRKTTSRAHWFLFAAMCAEKRRYFSRHLCDFALSSTVQNRQKCSGSVYKYDYKRLVTHTPVSANKYIRSVIDKLQRALAGFVERKSAIDVWDLCKWATGRQLKLAEESLVGDKIYAVLRRQINQYWLFSTMHTIRWCTSNTSLPRKTAERHRIT